jgi:hypothetical protein
MSGNTGFVSNGSIGKIFLLCTFCMRVTGYNLVVLVFIKTVVNRVFVKSFAYKLQVHAGTEVLNCFTIEISGNILSYTYRNDTHHF